MPVSLLTFKKFFYTCFRSCGFLCADKNTKRWIRMKKCFDIRVFVTIARFYAESLSHSVVVVRLQKLLKVTYQYLQTLHRAWVSLMLVTNYWNKSNFPLHCNLPFNAFNYNLKQYLGPIWAVIDVKIFSSYSSLIFTILDDEIPFLHHRQPSLE